MRIDSWIIDLNNDCFFFRYQQTGTKHQEESNAIRVRLDNRTCKCGPTKFSSFLFTTQETASLINQFETAPLHSKNEDISDSCNSNTRKSQFLGFDRAYPTTACSIFQPNNVIAKQREFPLRKKSDNRIADRAATRTRVWENAPEGANPLIIRACV
jgi:hypothetical protein